jgi:hypothetical protein
MAKQQPAPERSTYSWDTERVEEQPIWQGREEGRIREETTGANRPAGRSTARDVTSINPRDREPIDPESPFLIPA